MSLLENLSKISDGKSITKTAKPLKSAVDKIDDIFKSALEKDAKESKLKKVKDSMDWDDLKTKFADAMKDKVSPEHQEEVLAWFKSVINIKPA